MINDSDKIKITYNDLEKIVPPDNSIRGNSNQAHQQSITGNRQWGTIQDITSGAEVESSDTSILRKSWFYLSLSGLFAALIAWGICETGFTDGEHTRWGNIFLFPLMAASVSTALIVSELISEHSYRKAVTMGILSLLLGIILGFIVSFFCNLLFAILVHLITQSGGSFEASNPVVWIVRAVAWMVFGISSGVIYGLISQSKKKALYGIIGGVAGAGIGGLFFDPISLITHGGALSRCIGLMVYGLSTGMAISLVESALKDRWLYVSNGPLAGKQFILYKQVTHIGSDQKNDIFLFKDPSISPTHAVVELKGESAILNSYSPLYISGQPIQGARRLSSGDIIQIGKYTFNYQEKQNKGKK